MWVTFGHLRPSGHVIPDHSGDRGAVILVLAPHDHPTYQPIADVLTVAFAVMLLAFIFVNGDRGPAEHLPYLRQGDRATGTSPTRSSAPTGSRRAALIVSRRDNSIASRSSAHASLLVSCPLLIRAPHSQKARSMRHASSRTAVVPTSEIIASAYSKPSNPVGPDPSIAAVAQAALRSTPAPRQHTRRPACRVTTAVAETGSRSHRRSPRQPASPRLRLHLRQQSRSSPPYADDLMLCLDQRRLPCHARHTRMRIWRWWKHQAGASSSGLPGSRFSVRCHAWTAA